MTRARQLAVARTIHALQERQAARLARALTTFFRLQTARVVARYLAGQKAAGWYEVKANAADALFPDSEFEALRVLITKLLTPTVTTVSDLAAEMSGAPKLPPTDPALLDLLSQAGTRIRRVSDETRDAVRETLRVGAERGYSDYQIAHGVAKDDFRGIGAVVTESYAGRAATIARTEVATASQDAAHDRYRAAGVSEVDIVDGDGCGWDGHNDPDEADGSVRTLDEAEAQPLSHPNCVRISIPRLG